MNATAIQTANNTQPCFRKTIDKTTYVVRVHFSETSKETMQPKRLCRTKSSVCSVRRWRRCDFFVNLIKKSLTIRIR